MFSTQAAGFSWAEISVFFSDNVLKIKNLAIEKLLWNNLIFLQLSSLYDKNLPVEFHSILMKWVWIPLGREKVRDRNGSKRRCFHALPWATGLKSRFPFIRLVNWQRCYPVKQIKALFRNYLLPPFWSPTSLWYFSWFCSLAPYFFLILGYSNKMAFHFQFLAWKQKCWYSGRGAQHAVYLLDHILLWIFLISLHPACKNQ